MMRRFFVVWPPWWALALSGSFFAGFEGLMLYFTWQFDLLRETEALKDVSKQMVFLVGFSAVFYAIFRIWAFHPTLRPGYYQWLRGTPWTSAKPLPLGPVHLVWADAILLAIAVLLCWPRSGMQSFAVVQTFLFVYLGMLALTIANTGEKKWGYAVGFAIGVMALFAFQPLHFASAAAVSYVLAYFGLRRSLAGFPWDGTFIARTLTEKKVPKALGWPHDRLGPRVKEDTGPLDWRDVWLGGVLLGWGYFVAIDVIRAATGERGAENGGLIPLLALGVVGRLVSYMNGYLPPISLLGRVVSGRWIVPGYDQVFVAPVLAIVVGAAAVAVPLATGIDRAFTAPAAATLIVWILGGVGPNVEVWRLTGNHRIVPGMTPAAQARR